MNLLSLPLGRQQRELQEQKYQSFSWSFCRPFPKYTKSKVFPKIQAHLQGAGYLAQLLLCIILV